MKKIKCENCKSVFNGTEIINIYDSYFHTYIGTCPNCKSEELIDVEECEKCGKFEDCFFVEDGLCADCQANAVKRFQKILNENGFTDAERKFLSNNDYWY